MTSAEKAHELCNKMTLREKLGQISQTVAGYRAYERNNNKITFNDELKSVLKEYGGIGAVSGLFRADPWCKKTYGSGIEIEEREAAANELQRYIIENTRLGIPALIEIEASHGMQALGSVMYPTGLGCAAAFNPLLYKEMMSAIAKEIKLSGNHIGFITLLDVARDPRWGRVEEALGEDPFLASRYAEAAVKAFKEEGVLICAKHYFGAGGCQSGINTASVDISLREEREIYLSTSKAVCDAGADMIMAAYNAVNGEPIHLSKHYLTDVLRNELGFSGILISDGFGIKSAAGQTGCTDCDAAISALEAGINLSLADCGAFLSIEEVAEHNAVITQLINESCEKILEKKYELGLFENPYVATGQTSSYVKSGKCDDIAYRMAAESITMIKNNKETLPLSKNKKICVIGENADDGYCLLGDYTSPRKQGEVTTIRNGIEAVFKNSVYTVGWRFNGEYNIASALNAAQNSDMGYFRVSTCAPFCVIRRCLNAESSVLSSHGDGQES